MKQPKQRLKERNTKIKARYNEEKAKNKYTSDYIFNLLADEFWLEPGTIQKIVWS